MAKKQKKKNSENQPSIKSQAGIFQLAGWKKTRVIPAKDDYDIEREVKRVNLCLTTGQRQQGEWKNVTAWFRPHQFGDLKEAVDDFAEKLRQLNGSKDLEKGFEEEGD
jgi:hypothetical protein